MRTSAALLTILFLFSAVSAQVHECTDTMRKLTAAEKRLRDWPELLRYRDENTRLRPSIRGKNRVVFIGDSITDLWDDPGFGGFFPGEQYINRGISGQTTPQMLLRFRQDVISLKPRVVVILAGTNDIAGNTGPMTLEETGANLASMAELASANGVRVVFSSVLPVSDTVRREGGGFFIQTSSRPPFKIVEMNRWLKDYSAANGYTYLDYYNSMVDEKGSVKDGLTFDGLHPNKEGYKIMSVLAERAIKIALGDR